MKTLLLSITLIVTFLLFSCKGTDVQNPTVKEKPRFDYQNEEGCDGQIYPDPNTSPYVLPFLPDVTYETGLTNCSSSYHGAQYPDRYAYDFDMPVGSNFYACRGGVVAYVVNNQPSGGGNGETKGSGNWCIIDHLDNTFGIYLHSPENGVSVSVGDTVKQGDLLGITGMSGLAGYPHLHFIVVRNGYAWPYDPIPITFYNVSPADVVLKSHTEYTALDY